MNNFNITIKNKIYGGFLLMVLIFVINGILNYINVDTNDRIIKNSSETQRPSSQAIHDLSNMATRSKMLITNWVYLQGNNDKDKEDLKNLISYEYPALKTLIDELKVKWDNDSQRHVIDSVWVNFEKLIEVEKEIMSQLQSFENYEDPFVKLLAEDEVTSQVLPLVESIQDQISIAESFQNEATHQADINLVENADFMKLITLLSGLIMVILGIIGAYLMARSIINPIEYIKNVVLKMGKGELPKDRKSKFNNDEIGEMATATDLLIAGLQDTSNFAENIGKENYEADYKPLSEKDVLGNALLEMRQNLLNVSIEDKKRNWATEGLAMFGEILRTNNSDLNKLAEEITRNLVKYLNANQGGLFVIDNSEDDQHYMELKACYAWDKKKFLEQKIYKGEGLVGQSWQEAESIYLTDVPDDYIAITSGLGEASPTSILIVPLKVNDEIFGIIELASFQQLEDYQKVFVEKVAESIAATISTVRINAKTHILLEESQQMTEQMRAQEEEMRQNMEELQATQEEMQKEQKAVSEYINAVDASIASVEYDTLGRVQKANDKFLHLLGYSQEDLIGKHHSTLIDSDEKKSESYTTFWDELNNGKVKQGVFNRTKKNGDTVVLKGSYFPVKRNNGNVIKILSLVYDLTEYMNES